MDAVQKNAQQATDRFLSDLASHADALFHGPKYEQYAALCIRGRNDPGEAMVLLITSRTSGRWVIPKGWPIRGKKPHEAAAIEAFEEAGVRGKIKKKPFGYFTYLKQNADGRRFPCLVQIHLLDVEKICDIFPEKGERASEWVSLPEAARRVVEPELKGLFLSLNAKLLKRRKRAN